jgi:tetratricopeptide (TPR) repeat protein
MSALHSVKLLRNHTFLLAFHVCALTAIWASNAYAQNAADMMNLFGGLMRSAIVEGARAEWRKVRPSELTCIEQELQKQGTSTVALTQQGILPADGRIAGIRVGCASPPPVAQIGQPAAAATLQPLSATPTFDCTKARTTTARILCGDQAGAKADWDVSAAYWAGLSSLPESNQDAFKRGHEDWFQTLRRSCRFLPDQPDYSPQQRQCVLTAFQTRANAYRSRLRGDALAESKLSPEDHARLQSQLVTLGQLDGSADGEFGPQTREAIKRFQAEAGEPQIEYLTPPQRTRLAQAVPPTPPTGQAAGGTASSPSSPDIQTKLTPTEAANQCQSNDSDKRLVGCAAIINVKGKGYSVALADAFDGRCRSYIDLGQYQRASEDCKAAISLSPRHAYAYNNLAAALTGLGDMQAGIAAYSKSIELKSDFIYSYLGRANAFTRIGDKKNAKKDLDQALTIEPGNQQAKDLIASLAIETAKLNDARMFLDDVQKFIAKQDPVPASVMLIATDAAALQIAITQYDELAAVEGVGRLNGLLDPMNGFQEFRKSQQDERDRQTAQRLAASRNEGAKNLFFVDNYVKRKLLDPKAASLIRLREQIDTADKAQNIDDIIKANNALDAYVKGNGLAGDYLDIANELRRSASQPLHTPTLPKLAPVETALLQAARIYLDDAQSFLKTQSAIDKDKIAGIAREATILQAAIVKFDEAGASQSKKKLGYFLGSINGFVEFTADREAGRQRDRDRRRVLAAGKAEQGVYFIGEYLREHLADPKTGAILTIKGRLESSLTSNAVDETGIGEIDKANEALDGFVRDNALSEEYSCSIAGRQNAGVTPAAPPMTIDRLLTEKNKFALAGPDDDMVLLFNAAPSAPSVAKDITGKFVFLTGDVSVCVAQTSMDEDRTWFVQRALRQQGARNVKLAASLCDFPRVSTEIDIVAFQRGELRKQRIEYVIGLVDLINADILREYQVVTAAAYNADIQSIRAVSLQIATDIEGAKRKGFGVLAVTDAAIPVCAVTSNPVAQLGLKELLLRDKELVSRRLRFEWNIVDMTVGNAFVALSRLQCGYAAGDAAALQQLMLALRRDGKQYEFAPVWYSSEDVAAAGTTVLKQEDARKQAGEAGRQIDDAKAKERMVQKDAIERNLRLQNGARARSLKDRIQDLIRQAADKPLTAGVARRATETQQSFPVFSAWLNRRFDDQWEITDIASEIFDFGTVQWNGRVLDGIIVEATVKQKSRIEGVYKTDCFRFGLVDDAEFTVDRDRFDVDCGRSDSTIAAWKAKRQFKSLWNADLPQHADLAWPHRRFAAAGGRPNLAQASPGEGPSGRSVAQ